MDVHGCFHLCLAVVKPPEWGRACRGPGPVQLPNMGPLPPVDGRAASQRGRGRGGGLLCPPASQKRALARAHVTDEEVILQGGGVAGGPWGREMDVCVVSAGVCAVRGCKWCRSGLTWRVTHPVCGGRDEPCRHRQPVSCPVSSQTGDGGEPSPVSLSRPHTRQPEVQVLDQRQEGPVVDGAGQRDGAVGGREAVGATATPPWQYLGRMGQVHMQLHLVLGTGRMVGRIQSAGHRESSALGIGKPLRHAAPPYRRNIA